MAKVTSEVDFGSAPVAKINGRPVLQPSTCNRVPNLERRNSIKKTPLKSPTPPMLPPPRANDKPISSLTPPISPKPMSPRREAAEMAGMAGTRNLDRKKSKSFKEGYASEEPGSIAAVRREQLAMQQAQRKMRIAHYGRSKSAKFEAKVVPLGIESIQKSSEEEVKRCSFITSNSDPVYVAYHDEEWGVPVHDDKVLFELLVLSGAQVGSDWTSILKKREDFRNAFSGFDAEIVANLKDKRTMSISSEYGIDICQVRGVVDNSKKIFEIKKEFGSFDNYIWAFVNHKPISTNYKFGHKIPVKTSKSETISKDMVRRGFRFVGPTVIHAFMQAAGLTNDHLIICHRHLPCTLMAARKTLEAAPTAN